MTTRIPSLATLLQITFVLITLHDCDTLEHTIGTARVKLFFSFFIVWFVLLHYRAAVLLNTLQNGKKFICSCLFFVIV